MFHSSEEVFCDLANILIGSGSYSFVEVQSVYSTATADRPTRFLHFCIGADGVFSSQSRQGYSYPSAEVQLVYSTATACDVSIFIERERERERERVYLLFLPLEHIIENAIRKKWKTDMHLS